MESATRGWYAAFKAKDARFDGRFFVGVLSTGIYCRPVCRAKMPKAENCAFYPSAAAAEQAGYRPCLLCRPELAPGNAPVDAASGLALRAARLLEANCGSGESLAKLAARLGCTDRHLRRVFMAQYNVSPVQYLQTWRLLLAKNLLTDTDLALAEIAMAAGFGSVRRFNDLFKNRYRLSPGALRRQSTTGKGESITLALTYRPPYQWRQILDFFAQRTIAGVELVKDNQYFRTVRLAGAGQKHICGWLRVGHQPQDNALSVSVDTALLPVLPQVLARVRCLFDLNCDPQAIYETLGAMNDIRPGLCVIGTRLPGSFDTFELAARVVLGQQITVKAARTLAARLVDTFGVPVQTNIEGLTRAFPSPETILALKGPIENHFGPLGIIGSRAKSILELARLLQREHIGLCAQPEEEIKKLQSIAGIGAWTAQCIAMRAMQWPDAFLETDVGIKKALAPHTPKQLLQLAEAWRPWRSYATINLWNAI